MIASGSGPRITDVDGNSYIDLVASWGPLILGHANSDVVRAVQEAALDGFSFGAPTEREVLLAELITSAMPSIEQLRFVSSGTEATMSALRVARGFTGRERILKFDGGYHGHSDSLLVAAGSGVLTLGAASSAGVPETWASSTLSVPYNDLQSVEDAFHRYPADIAAVIVEPIAGNMGVVPPKPGFLEGIRAITRDYGAVLVFDEVITGFRVGLGGAQERFGIGPDLTCLGKIIGGGLPVGAYGGRRELMGLVSPEGPVYQAGTLSGNPLSMAAGIATLQLLFEPGVYPWLNSLGERLAVGLRGAADAAGVSLQIQRVGSMLTPFFVDQSVRDEQAAKRSDTERYGRFFHALLDRGVYVPPSQFEAWFLSLAHTEPDVDAVIQAVGEAMSEAAKVG
ncbi:MAG: glutamate-1-semialdehyde-2,1-aminomutase [Chloroflexi bacterium]|nr:glutamate-1-semialdehyde-2,1-aminomutase [Chloroflexota bacterium]